MINNEFDVNKLKEERSKWLADFLLKKFREYASAQLLAGNDMPTRGQFSKTIGIESPTFSHIVTGTRSPSNRTIGILSRTYPEIKDKFGVYDDTDPALMWLQWNWSTLKKKGGTEEIIEIAKAILARDKNEN